MEGKNEKLSSGLESGWYYNFSITVGGNSFPIYDLDRLRPMTWNGLDQKGTLVCSSGLPTGSLIPKQEDP